MKNISVLLLSLLLLVGTQAYAQETGGKKLRNTEKAKPVKIKTKKVKNSKRSKAKGNPNKSNQKVESSNPAKWDWGKIMWFRANKSDYETNQYNPNKKTKRKKYSNDTDPRSEHREAGEGNRPLSKPLIPYDTRIDDKGPIIVKKQKPKNLDVKKVGPTVDVPVINVHRPEETLVKTKKDKKDPQFDGKKLYTTTEKNKPKPFDQSKLETAKVSKDKPKMDDDKLMVITVNKNKPKPFDNKKLMTSEVIKLKKQDLHDDRLMIEVPKIERSKLHDDRLLTVDERHYPSKTMKRITEDIAAYQGDYKVTVKKGKDYHPSSRHLASKRHGIPWLKRTQQSLSVFWSKIWPWDLQPTYVTDKKPKIKRDKKEGQIWDNTVHPNSWNTKPEQAESGED